MDIGNLEKGILYALMAGIIWGVGPLLLKRGMALSNVSTATLVQQFACVTYLVSLAAFKGELRLGGLSPTAFWCFVLAGSVGATVGKISLYKGIDRVGASKSITIKNSAPLLTVVIGVLVLGEALTLPVVTGVALIVTGVFLLSRMVGGKGSSSYPTRYLFYPLIAAFCFGLNPILKKIGLSDVSLPVLGTLVTQSTALILILTVGRLMNIKPRWEPVPWPGLLLFIATGVIEGTGSVFTFYALSYGPAILVSPIWRIQPLVTYVLANFTLKGIEVVTMRDGVAALFIVGGVFVLSRG